MPLQLTNKITYDSHVGNILNSKERITNGLKRVIVFWCAWSVCKAIIKFLNDELTDRPEFIDDHFFSGFFPFVISSVK
jgi:hypothetical protein